MKAQLLVLSAAALMAASVAHAASPAQQFADRAEAQAQARLEAVGVDLNAPVAVRASVASDGRLNGLHVVRSSGSRDVDHAVEEALKKMKVADPPALIGGAQVTLALGGSPIVQAEGQAKAKVR